MNVAVRVFFFVVCFESFSNKAPQKLKATKVRQNKSGPKLIVFTFTSEVTGAQTQRDREMTETKIIYHFKDLPGVHLML